MLVERWLNRLATEGHQSEALAARWHRGHAWAYAGLAVCHGALCGLYIGAALWHGAASTRHARNARHAIRHAP